MKNTKWILCVFIYWGISNCKVNDHQTYEKRLKEAYIYNFKMQYFKKVLLEGFNRTNEIEEILKFDASKGIADMHLSPNDLNKIDSLAKLDNTKMVSDSLKNINKAEGAQGKYVFSYAIEKFNSKWLDSLARASYKLASID